MLAQYLFICVPFGQIRFLNVISCHSLNSSTLDYCVLHEVFNGSQPTFWVIHQGSSTTFFLKLIFFSTGEMSTNISVVDLNTSDTNQMCDVFVYQRAALIIFPIFYSLVFLISVCGNCLVLYVTCQKKQKFNSTSLYLVNLAVSDALFTLALPGRVTYYIRQFDWPFGDLLCRLATMLFFSNTYSGKVCVCIVWGKLCKSCSIPQ